MSVDFALPFLLDEMKVMEIVMMRVIMYLVVMLRLSYNCLLFSSIPVPTTIARCLRNTDARVTCPGRRLSVRLWSSCPPSISTLPTSSRIASSTATETTASDSTADPGNSLSTVI